MPCSGFSALHGVNPNFKKISITLVDVHLNWINWFHFLIFVGGLLVILIDCMLFLSPFLDAASISMSIVSFLTELDPGILCL